MSDLINLIWLVFLKTVKSLPSHSGISCTCDVDTALSAPSSSPLVCVQVYVLCVARRFWTLKTTSSHPRDPVVPTLLTLVHVLPPPACCCIVHVWLTVKFN